MKKIFVLAFIGLITYLVIHYQAIPTRIIPYPYIIETTSWPAQTEAENANVLIIGDKMGQALSSYIPELIKSTSKNLRTPLRIYNWAQNNEGLHRTLAKVRSLKKMPALIIYHGAAQELYEKKFHYQENDIILDNMSKYEDETLLSLILTVPLLSRFIYKPHHFVKLSDNIKEDKTIYPAKHKQKQMELTYKLYELELEELITFVKDQGSKLVVLTTPINLDVPPRKTCNNAMTDTTIELHEQAEALLKKGEIKQAYNQLSNLIKATVANAYSYYLTGIAAKKMGNYQKAKKMLQLSAVFDCESWRSNSIFNAIIRQKATTHKLFLVDFDEQVNQHFGHNVLFIDEIYPQDLFYGQLIKTLGATITQILHI